jgi:uracil phosphoribosyltransferase
VGLNLSERTPTEVFGLGMGVDNCSVLLRLMTDPASRDSALEGLAVVTAQTGDERETARTEIESLILPMLRANRSMKTLLPSTFAVAGCTALLFYRVSRGAYLSQ